MNVQLSISIENDVHDNFQLVLIALQKEQWNFCTSSIWLRLYYMSNEKGSFYYFLYYLLAICSGSILTTSFFLTTYLSGLLIKYNTYKESTTSYLNILLS